MGQLFLRQQSDIQALLRVIAENGLAINEDAVEYARDVLTDDWLTLFQMGGPNCICNLLVRPKRQVGYSLPQWVEIIGSLYELRGAEGINEQVRRLCIPGHERLDTAFAVVVANRYKSRAWAVAFEPNGRGCSDLRLAQGSKQFYIEVKRQNTDDHVRLNNFRANSNAILDTLPSSLIEWLNKNDRRIQVKFFGGLSPSLIARICSELSAKVPHAPIGVEQPLSFPQKGGFVLLHRDSEQHFKNGHMLGRVLVPTVPIQLNDPRNSPVQIVFDWPPNLKAIGAQIKKAKRQLQNDVAMDPGAKGFIVIQASGGEQVGIAIEQRFLCNLPSSCWGITLVSEGLFGGGQLICRDDLDAETLEVMGHAAKTVPFWLNAAGASR
jgi:hypothetical protein